MSIVNISGRQIKTEADIHRILSKQLDFGPYYGKNLDALWDRLTVDVERPVRIVWTEAAESRENLGADLFEKVVDLMRAVERQDLNNGLSERFIIEVVE